MGGGVWVSTYAVRRLKYEKVDRVEQIGKLSKISEPILPTCFFPRKLDGREKLSGGRKLFLRHYLRYYRIIEKIISKYSCILSVENSKASSPKEFFSKWFFNEAVYNNKGYSNSLHKNMARETLRKRADNETKSNFYIPRANNPINKIPYIFMQAC